MATVPQYIFRDEYLYAIIPELKEVDMNIGPTLNQNINLAKTAYEEALANATSLTDLYNSDPLVVNNYIRYLEQNIMMRASPAFTSNAIPYYTAQKVSLLESTYSNLFSSN